MKSLKKLAGMIGLVILLCGIMTGCSGKRLYSEEELTQIHDVVGAVEQITKEFQYVIGGSMQSLLEDSSSRADLMDYVSTRKYDPDKKIIALTFDDGPSTADTNGTSDLLDVLEQYDSRATFFCVGNNINDKSGPLLKRMVELGCEVGNHCYDHAQLTKLDAKGVHDEIDTTNELIKKYSGRDCRIIRPPYGAADNDIVPANVSQPFIMWDVDTEDWKSLNASKVIASVERYRNQDWDGAVILMHDIHPTTVEACKTLIPELVNAGYQLVTVSELAYLKGLNWNRARVIGALVRNQLKQTISMVVGVRPLRKPCDKKEKSPIENVSCGCALFSMGDFSFL